VSVAGELTDDDRAASIPAIQGRPRSRALDEVPNASWNAPLIATAGTVCVHGALVMMAMWLGLRRPESQALSVAVTEMVEVELPATPPEPKVEEPPPPPPEPEEKPRAAEPPPRVREHKAEPEPAKAPTQDTPPPEAAAAAQVLTQDAPEVADFAESIVVGDGAVHAGGTTEAGGTATRAVRNESARAGGVPGGTGHDVTADLSRQPQLAGGFDWNCPFPEEADEEGLDSGDVTLRVEVGADGAVIDVQVRGDPGYGFGREARRCALRKRWVAGLDRAGRAARSVAQVRVKFERR
jgi:protein TonB